MPGEELYRFATVNDIHIGETGFGAFFAMQEPDDVEPYPSRCLKAAMRESAAWGAQRLLAKGDLTDHGEEEEFEWFAALAAESTVPLDVLLGNHDMRNKEEVDGGAILRARGVHVAVETEHIDVPGLRIILLPSAKGGHDAQWKASDRAAAIELAAESPTPVFVATHHYPQRFNVPNAVPGGVPRREAAPFLDELDRVAPGSLIAAGHTHRHHRRHYKSLLFTEIGSPKDWPGVWAGYTVHEGGIRQIVQQINDPSCRPWINRTAHAIGGAWKYWSPGIRSHRCWTWEWPTSG